jgi:hypothetical protein
VGRGPATEVGRGRDLGALAQRVRHHAFCKRSYTGTPASAVRSYSCQGTSATAGSAGVAAWSVVASVLARGTSEITAAPSAVTLGAALDSRLELIISPQLPQEIAMVLARPRLWKHLSSEEALQFVTDLAGQTTLMADPPGPEPAVSRVPTTITSSPLATPTGADAYGHRRSRLPLSDTINSA